MKFHIIFLSIILACMSGCSTISAIINTPEQVFTTQIQEKPIVKITPISNIPITNITIKQGLTTKQQIINQLGQPDSYINSRQGDFMSYHVYDNNRIINLTYIEKNGTKFSYTISREQNTKKNITIGINLLNNTVGSIIIN